AREADDLPVNHAQAEELFLMKPDLVLAGTFSSRATVGLLRKLGVRVEEFAPARSFSDIEDHLRRMGDLLGKQVGASQQVDKMKAALAAIRPPAQRKPVALYYANGDASGQGTLVDEAVRLAGLGNLADRAGIRGSAPLPLEKLVLENPDILVRSS